MHRRAKGSFASLVFSAVLFASAAAASAQTRVSLTVTPSIAPAGQPVTFKGTITRDGVPRTTGVLSIYASGVLVAAVTPDAQGRFQHTTATLPVGSHVIRGSYGTGPFSMEIVEPAPLRLTIVAAGRGGAWGRPLPLEWPGQTDLALADFNGDGRLDLVTASDSQGFSVRFGNGDGTFLPSFGVETGRIAQRVLAFDVDGDGDNDIVVAGILDDAASLQTLLNDGTGAFSAGPELLDDWADFTSATVANLNGDRFPDVLAAGNANLPVRAFYGAADGSFTVAPLVNQYADNAWAAAADVNGDTVMDVIAVTSVYVELPPDLVEVGTLHVFLGSVTGAFTKIAEEPSPRPVGQLVTGDFNRDGFADLVIPHGAGGALRAGRASGMLGAATPFVSPGWSHASLAADFNGDGHLDLASTATVVQMGRGDGTFEAGVVVDPQPWPQVVEGAVATGDLNGDGRLDLIVSHVDVWSGGAFNAMMGGDSASVSLTTDAGTRPLGQPVRLTANVTGGALAPTGNVTFLANGSPVGSAAVDAAGTAAFDFYPAQVGTYQLRARYDGDANHGASLSSSTTLVSTRAEVRLRLNVYPSTPVAGELLDIIVTYDFYAGSEAGGSMTLFVDGTPVETTFHTTPGAQFRRRLPVGVYELSVQYSGGVNYLPGAAGPVTVAIEKASTTTSLDRVDTAVTAGPVTLKARVSVPWPGSSNGVPFAGTVSFVDGATVIAVVPVDAAGLATATATLPPRGWNIKAVFAGDANFLPSQSAPVPVSVVRTGGGGFKPPVYAPLVSSGGLAATGDLNGDGHIDVIVAQGEFENSMSKNTRLSVFPGTGGLTFGERRDFVLLHAPIHLTVADVNLDGHLDVIVVEDARHASEAVETFLGDGTGGFSTVWRLHLGGISTPGGTVADIDGDGVPEVVVARQHHAAVAVAYQPVNPDWFGDATVLGNGFSQAQAIVAGDISGDGRADIIVADGAELRVFVTGAAASVPRAMGHYPTAMTLADLNGDGHRDLIASCAMEGLVLTFLNDGTGTFGAPAVHQAPGYPGHPLVADVDADGALDVVVSNRGIDVLRGRGDGTLDPYHVALGSHARRLALADVDGDGLVDALVPGTSLELLRGAAPVVVTLSSDVPEVGRTDETYTFTAAVSALRPPDGAPSGTVRFTDDRGVVLADVALENGQAALARVLPPLFSDVVATYLGDDTFGGNSAAASLFTNDTTPPSFSGVPWGVLIEAAGPAGAVGTFEPPSANDNGDGPLVVTCAPASGSMFPLGTSVVTCTATDSWGNIGAATFDVTVHDTTPPAIADVPANITVEAPVAEGAVVTYAPPSANDIVDGPLPVSCAPPSGSTFGVGTTMVSCVVADAAGNAASASFSVTVTAGPPPPPPPDPEGVSGAMTGRGTIDHVNGDVEFEFAVRLLSSGRLSGGVRIEQQTRRRGRAERNRFQASEVTSAVFTDAPGTNPGARPASGVDTVEFTGVGRWNGTAGFRYVVAAQDRGEPGRNRDVITITVVAPDGSPVLQATGTLGRGNIASRRAR